MIEIDFLVARVHTSLLHIRTNKQAANVVIPIRVCIYNIHAKSGIINAGKEVYS